MIKKITFLLTTIFLFACATVIAADSVGTVIAIQGQVYAANEAGGARRSLQRHSEIYLQEFITTQESSMAQLKLKDDTIISLKPNTKYSVSAFNLDAKNPKNNRYVGNLVEGVLISFSGQGENSTHNNHVLQTPVESIAIRGTLYESGFKIKNYNANKTVYKTLGIGWVNVESGAVDVVSGGGIRRCDLVSKEADNNASFTTSSGTLDKNGHFKVGARAEVSIVCTSNVMMRKLVTTALKASNSSAAIAVTSTTSAVPAATFGVTSTQTNAQQGVQNTIENINSGSGTPTNFTPPLPPNPPGTPPILPTPTASGGGPTPF